MFTIKRIIKDMAATIVHGPNWEKETLTPDEKAFRNDADQSFQDYVGDSMRRQQEAPTIEENK